jgi:glycosyltransferase involved in cell wall biosynthesis
MRELQTDIARSGLQEMTFVFPPAATLTAWMRRADVFALLSREDSFPVVALEAGAAGKPVLCFEGTGGAADMIAASGGGWVFPYLDVRQIAETLESVTPDEIAARGAKIKAHVDENHRYERVMERLEGRVKKVMG